MKELATMSKKLETLMIRTHDRVKGQNLKNIWKLTQPRVKLVHTAIKIWPETWCIIRACG